MTLVDPARFRAASAVRILDRGLDSVRTAERVSVETRQRFEREAREWRSSDLAQSTVATALSRAWFNIDPRYVELLSLILDSSDGGWRKWLATVQSGLSEVSLSVSRPSARAASSVRPLGLALSVVAWPSTFDGAASWRSIDGLEAAPRARFDQLLTTVEDFLSWLEADERSEQEPWEAGTKVVPGSWYVLYTRPGTERKVKTYIQGRRRRSTAREDIYQVEVLREGNTDMGDSPRRAITRRRPRGYVAVRMDYNEKSWEVVRHARGVTGSLGGANDPTALDFDPTSKGSDTAEKVTRLMNLRGKTIKSISYGIKRDVNLKVGEGITIRGGSFAGRRGTISEIKRESGKVRVTVRVGDGETHVELGRKQVAKRSPFGTVNKRSHAHRGAADRRGETE